MSGSGLPETIPPESGEGTGSGMELPGGESGSLNESVIYFRIETAGRERLSAG